MKLANCFTQGASLTGLIFGLGLSLTGQLISQSYGVEIIRRPSQVAPSTQKKPFPKQVVIQAKIEGEAGVLTRAPAYFIIENDKEHYFLKWVTRDPRAYLDPKVPLFIQLITQHPIQVNPAYITQENWPKDGKQLELIVTGVTAKTDNRLLGKASYSYCHSGEQKCTPVLLPMVYRLNAPLRAP